MNNEQRSQLLEAYDETALTLLMDDYAEEMGEQLWTDFEIAIQNDTAPVIPEALDKKCQKIIKESVKQNTWSIFSARLKKSMCSAAIFAVMILSISSILFLSVDAIRIPLKDFFFEHNSRSTTTANNNDALAGNDKLMALEKIISPGYAVSDCYIGEENREFYSFKDENNHDITIIKDPITSTYDIDMEDTSEHYTTIINGYDAIFIEKSGYRVIVYNTDENTIYNIFSNGLLLDEFWELVYRLLA